MVSPSSLGASRSPGPFRPLPPSAVASCGRRHQANPGRPGDAKPRDWMDSPIQLAGLPTLQLVQGESVSPKTQEVYMVRIRSVLTHSTQAVVEGSLISLLVVGLLAGAA